MIRSLKTKTVAVAAVSVIALGAGGVAYAATAGSDAPTPLTGSITDQASKAVVDRYPGSTLVGIESRPDGTFEAHVRKSDGTRASVSLDEDFKVTATREGGPGRGGPGGFGPRGHGPGGFGPGADPAALATSLGVSEERLRAAIEKVRPEKGDRREERAAAIAKALGASTADVQSVLEEQGPGGPGRGGPGPGGPGRGPRGDASALVTALAKKTGKSEADVRKALEAARPEPGARRDELAAALAKDLGLETAKVRAALEAARPARP